MKMKFRERKCLKLEKICLKSFFYFNFSLYLIESLLKQNNLFEKMKENEKKKMLKSYNKLKKKRRVFILMKNHILSSEITAATCFGDLAVRLYNFRH